MVEKSLFCHREHRKICAMECDKKLFHEEKKNRSNVVERFDPECCYFARERKFLVSRFGGFGFSSEVVEFWLLKLLIFESGLSNLGMMFVNF
jgi:hypothetical protein